MLGEIHRLPLPRHSSLSVGQKFGIVGGRYLMEVDLKPIEPPHAAASHPRAHRGP